MALSITNNMNLITNSDVTGGWSDDGLGVTAYSGFQREGSAALGGQVSLGTGHAWFLTGSTDLSNSTIFAWMRSGNPTTQATGGFRIVVGDGTNRIAYYVGGSDNQGFSVLGWNLYKLNLANKPTGFDTLAGSEASLNEAAITEVGVGFNYNSKSSGNSDNVFWDIIRYVVNGNPALTITAGTSADPGTWANIVTSDESTTNAWGIMRRLVPGAENYGLNFRIEFGDGTASTNYFNGSDAIVTSEGDLMTAGAMDLIFNGGTGTNSYKLDNFTFLNTGTLSNWNFNDSAIDELEITATQFIDAGTFTYPPSGANIFTRNTIFNSTGAVTINTAEFTNCQFNNSTGNAVIATSNTFNVTESSFNTPGDAAIVLDLSGPTEEVDFSGITFTGTTSLGPFDVDFTGSGDLTINSIDGSNVDETKVRLSGGGTVTVVANPVTTTITVRDVTTDAILPNVRVLVEAAVGGGLPVDASVSITRVSSTATVTHTGHGYSTGQVVKILGSDQVEYNGLKTITVTGTNTYTFSVTGTPATPATGTITATTVIINGLTSGLGTISDTRSIGIDQPITGKARLSTTSPYYKSQPISGIIDSETGTSITVLLIPDE